MELVFKTEHGTVRLEKEVVKRIAGSAAIECYGIVGMCARSVRDGISRLLKRDKLTKGVTVETEGEGIIIDLHIIVEYGMNIPVTCESIISTVKYKVEEETGLSIKGVNVFVDGLRVN